jgi:hypothetical protein
VLGQARGKPGPTVAIDLDGTILQAVDYAAPILPSGQPALSPPMEGVQAALNILHDLGYTMLVHTARFADALGAMDRAAARDEIAEHLQAHGMGDMFDDIVVGPKPIADYYIDDKAVKFEGDWTDVLRQISTLRGKSGATMINTPNDDQEDWTDADQTRQDRAVIIGTDDDE